MSFLSKAEIQFLKGQKQVSKSYERKLKCVIKRKIEVLKDELPLLSKILNIKEILLDATNTSESQITDDLDILKLNQATEFSNHNDKDDGVATEFSNTTYGNYINSAISLTRAKDSILTDISGIYYHSIPFMGIFRDTYTKYYINNPSSLIKNAVRSGGVEVINQSSHTIRLSISPSQGDDPGFKSRPEHPLFGFF